MLEPHWTLLNHYENINIYNRIYRPFGLVSPLDCRDETLTENERCECLVTAQTSIANYQDAKYPVTILNNGTEEVSQRNCILALAKSVAKVRPQFNACLAGLRGY